MAVDSDCTYECKGAWISGPDSQMLLRRWLYWSWSQILDGIAATGRDSIMLANARFVSELFFEQISPDDLQLESGLEEVES